MTAAKTLKVQNLVDNATDAELRELRKTISETLKQRRAAKVDARAQAKVERDQRRQARQDARTLKAAEREGKLAAKEEKRQQRIAALEAKLEAIRNKNKTLTKASARRLGAAI